MPDISDAVLPWVIGVGSLAVFSAAWTALGLVVFTSRPYRRLRDRIAGKLSGRTVLVAESGCDDCSVEPGRKKESGMTDIETYPDGPIALLTVRDANGVDWKVGAQLGDEAIGVHGNSRPITLVLKPGASITGIKVVEGGAE